VVADIAEAIAILRGVPIEPSGYNQRENYDWQNPLVEDVTAQTVKDAKREYAILHTGELPTVRNTVAGDMQTGPEFRSKYNGSTD
jgi:hypothetical protein